MLDDLVAYAGALVSAAVAIRLGWRGRTRFEPSEEDIDRGPQKIGSLVTALGIAVIITRRNAPNGTPLFTSWVIGLGFAAISAFILYSFLVGTLTFSVPITRGKARRVIGGFWLTPEARKIRRQRKLTTQEVFAGAAYDKDKVWPRLATGLSRTSFLILYLAVTVCGSVALACAAMLYSFTLK